MLLLNLLVSASFSLPGGSRSSWHGQHGLAVVLSFLLMAEVHLTIHDRRMIAQTFEGNIDYPPNIKRGTWYRLKQGTLDFIDLSEWLELWDIFPPFLQVSLRNGKQTAPKNDRAFEIKSGKTKSRLSGPRLLPDHDRRPWKNDDW